MNPICLKLSLALALSLNALSVASAQAAASAAITQASPTQTKEQVVQHLLRLWHVESVGLTMLRVPIEESLRQSRSLLQGRVSSEKQAETMKDIEAYAQEFMEQTAPGVLERSRRLIPTTVAPILMANFTEDELRQIIALLESPVKVKFEALVPEMQKALGQKMATNEGPQIKPKMEALQTRIGLRLRAAVTP